MPWPVFHVSDQLGRCTFRSAQFLIHKGAQQVYDIDILPFVETADIVFLSCLSFVKDGIDGAGMIFHIEPVPYILSFTIDGSRLVVENIVDHQMDQRLGAMMRTRRI